MLRKTSSSFKLRSISSHHHKLPSHQTNYHIRIQLLNHKVDQIASFKDQIKKDKPHGTQNQDIDNLINRDIQQITLKIDNELNKIPLYQIPDHELKQFIEKIWEIFTKIIDELTSINQLLQTHTSSLYFKLLTEIVSIAYKGLNKVIDLIGYRCLYGRVCLLYLVSLIPNLQNSLKLTYLKETVTILTSKGDTIGKDSLIGLKAALNYCKLMNKSKKCPQMYKQYWQIYEGSIAKLRSILRVKFRMGQFRESHHKMRVIAEQDGQQRKIQSFKFDERGQEAYYLLLFEFYLQTSQKSNKTHIEIMKKIIIDLGYQQLYSQLLQLETMYVEKSPCKIKQKQFNSSLNQYNISINPLTDNKKENSESHTIKSQSNYTSKNEFLNSGQILRPESSKSKHYLKIKSANKRGWTQKQSLHQRFKKKIKPNIFKSNFSQSSKQFILELCNAQIDRIIAHITHSNQIPQHLISQILQSSPPPINPHSQSHTISDQDILIEVRQVLNSIQSEVLETITSQYNKLYHKWIKQLTIDQTQAIISKIIKRESENDHYVMYSSQTWNCDLIMCIYDPLQSLVMSQKFSNPIIQRVNSSLNQLSLFSSKTILSEKIHTYSNIQELEDNILYTGTIQMKTLSRKTITFVLDYQIIESKQTNKISLVIYKEATTKHNSIALYDLSRIGEQERQIMIQNIEVIIGNILKLKQDQIRGLSQSEFQVEARTIISLLKQ